MSWDWGTGWKSAAGRSLAELQRISPSIRKLVAERARGICEYCHSQQRYSPDPYSAEHIIPRSSGGSSDVNNLAWSCLGCNGFKYTNTSATDPATGGIVPLFNPRSDQWSEHFAWSVGFTHIVGITPTGRATIDRLRLNRDGVVELRRVLQSVGCHPPE